jgi:hypothetical protein
MSFPSSGSSSPPKRPRLSLQIKAPTTAITFGKSVTALKADIDPSSPTAFNTLSNAYAAAIENSSPASATPRTARPFDSKSGKPTSLRLETKNFTRQNENVNPSQRTQTPGPFAITYPDTPSSAFPSSNLTPITALPESEPRPVASSFTFTPPQSAGTEQPIPRIFAFAANDNTASPSSPRTPRRRMTTGNQFQVAPYTHPRSLHSILRNSPLPPRNTMTPATPSRMSVRIANRASKKVGYNDPLTQTITTNKYIKSHIELLAEDSPLTATDPEAEKIGTLELAMAYSGDETRDGGHTPGPFEEMRRRMAESGLETPATRKRKRKEKKRKWEWTITSTETDDEDIEAVGPGRTPVTALKIEPTPITAIRRGVSVSASEDSEMSEAEERYVPSVSTDSMMEGNEWESEGRPGSCDSLRPQTSHSV